MSYAKMMVAVAAALALTAVFSVGSASATVLCKSKSAVVCPSGQTYGIGTELKAKLRPGTQAVITHGLITDKCSSSTMSATVSNAGGKGSPENPVQAKVNSVTLTECGSCQYEILNNGTLVMNWISVTRNATVSQPGFRLSQTCNGVNCKYGSTTTGKNMTLYGGAPATIKEEATLPKIEGVSGWCNDKATLTLEYEVTSPNPLHVSYEAE